MINTSHDIATQSTTGPAGGRPRLGRRAVSAVGLALALTVAGAPLAFAATGDPDSGFSSDGIATTSSGTRNATATAVALDGTLVVAGVGSFATDGSPSLTGVYVGRYATDGSLVDGFGTHGLTSFNVTPGAEIVRGVTVDPQGRILVTGITPATDYPDISDVFVARLTPTGSLDTTFGGGDGIAQIDLSNHDRAGGVVVSGSRIWLGVTQDDSGNWANKWTAVALTSTGAYDTTFSGDGRAEVPTAKLGTYDGLRDIALQKDGKILLGGVQGTGYGVARLTKTGTLDTSWDADGVATTAMSGEGNKLVVQSDGKVILAGFGMQAGRSDNDLAAVRYTTAGALDKSFSTDGKAYASFGTSDDRGYSAVAAADGKILLGGYATTGTSMDFGVARLNYDGTLDTSFSDDGLVTTSTNSVSNERIEAMALGAGDRVYAVGENLDGWALVAYSGHANRNLSIADTSMTEGNTGKTNAVFTVTLSAATTSTVTVNFATADGTALAGKDYVKTTGKVTFAPGQTSRTIAVPVVGEKLKEQNETFKVNISLPANAGLTNTSAVGTILNND
jgi:uncharacterized delta-60 repeat protein